MDRPRSRKAAVASWTAQAVAATILGLALSSKLTGAPESRALFEALGAEPWGRWASGAAELAAVVLLLVPRTAALGAVLALGVMAGAIGAHLTGLGIEVQGDGGTLFALALVTTAASATVAWLRRGDLPLVGPALAGRAGG
jgi:hypothetical protein